MGVSIRFEPIVDISDQAWRILDVVPESPAAVGGLIAAEDFIMGSIKGPFREYEFLERSIEENMDKPMIMMVYNLAKDTIREVSVTPKKSPDGSLGCDLGQGISKLLSTPYCDHNRGSSSTAIFNARGGGFRVSTCSS